MKEDVQVMNKVFLYMGIVMLSLFLVGCGNTNDAKNNVDDTDSNGVVDDTVNNDQAEMGDNNMNKTNNNAADDNRKETNDEVNTQTDTTTEGKRNYQYSFEKFELDVDYDDMDDAIEVEFDNEPNDELEASYEDRTKDIRLHGEEAMSELDSIFSSFNFDENTSEDEVLDAVVEAFDIRDDARKIELEIEYGTGVEKEYHR